MPLLCPIDSLGDKHELVICDSAFSRQAHKELFRFNEKAYVVANTKKSIFDMVAGIARACNETPEKCPPKIHMSLNWENILRISTWKSSKPAVGDVFTILRTAGLSQQELQPYKSSDINDIFPWLYYGKRFDILRKVCHSTKRQMENRLKRNSIRVDCHLVVEDTMRIVASSL